jgi:hypothetical protein
MNAKIEVEFLEINGIKVDESLLKNVPQLKDSTKKTVKILCDNIEKYFKDNKIKTKATFEIK